MLKCMFTTTKGLAMLPRVHPANECMPACLPACLAGCLPAYIHTYRRRGAVVKRVEHISTIVLVNI